MNNSSLYTKTITMSMVKGTGLEMPTIQHFEFPADDVERARKFYIEVFGCGKWRSGEILLCCLILYPNTTSVPVILYSSKQVIQ